MTKKIIVVGAGIAGLTAAYTLQKDGFDVEVLERNDAVLRNGKFVSGNYAGFRAIWKAKDLGFASKLRLPLILNGLRRARRARFLCHREGSTAR